MAAIGTNTETLSTGTFSPLYVAVNGVNSEAVTLARFDPWPNPSTGFLQRVWDSGLSLYCYYEKTEIDPTPLSSETTPNYTGAISAHSVVVRE